MVSEWVVADEITVSSASLDDEPPMADTRSGPCRISVAAPAHLLLAEPMAAAEWWTAARSGIVRMVSLGADEGAADPHRRR